MPISKQGQEITSYDCNSNTAINNHKRIWHSNTNVTTRLVQTSTQVHYFASTKIFGMQIYKECPRYALKNSFLKNFTKFVE